MCPTYNTNNTVINKGLDVLTLIFKILQVLSHEDVALACCFVEYSETRNNKIQNDVIDAQSFVVERAKSLLFDWKVARKVSHITIKGMQTFILEKHLVYYRLQSGCMNSIYDMLPLSSTLNKWQIVFCPRKHDVIEFKAIIDLCRALFGHIYESSSVEFIKRQVNEVVHELAKAVTLSASFQILIDILNCIEHILSNDIS